MARNRFRIDEAPPQDQRIVPLERDPLTGRPVRFDRDNKNSRQERRPGDHQIGPIPRSPSGRPDIRTPGRRRTWALAGAAAVVTAAVIVAAVVIGSSTGTPGPASAGAGASLGPGTSPTPPPARSSSVTSDAAAKPVPGSASARSSGPATRSSADTAGSGSAPGSGSAAGKSQLAGTSPSASPVVPTKPAYLDPDRLVGYDTVVTFVADREGGKPDGLQGEVYRDLVGCNQDGCYLTVSTWTFSEVPFKVGTARIHYVEPELGDGSSSACTPWTHTLDLTLDKSTGRYSGTDASVPRAEVGPNCQASAHRYTFLLTPVITPDLSSIPAGTPAVLDPRAIRGYRGTTASGGTTSDVEFGCSRGVCRLSCRPLCNGTLALPAAADTWTLHNVYPNQTCGKGTTTISLVRSGDGGYSGTITASYATKVDPTKCPASITMSLTPIT